METTKTKTVHYADCDSFDNCRTGFYATAAEAESAFWLENRFSKDEIKRVQVYTREVNVDSEAIEQANYLAGTGSPSPGLGIEATA